MGEAEGETEQKEQTEHQIALHTVEQHVLLAGIIVAEIGALWAGLSHTRFFLFIAFILLSLTLISLRFPHSWASIIWLAMIYLLIFFGTTTALSLTGQTILSLPIGGGMVFLGLWLGGRFLVHVKISRDRKKDLYYVPLGLWGLALAVFLVSSALSAVGFYLWAKGGGLGLYVASEVVLAFSIPYMLLKTEEIGVGILHPEDLIRYRGEDRCPECNAILILEKKRCPHCGATTVFRWCPISEAYVTTCPACKERVLWGRTCSKCGAPLPESPTCPGCGRVVPFGEWENVA